MGGEGSMLHMILSYRNNRKLRSKKTIFEKEKTFGESTTTTNAAHKEIKVKHLSPDEIKYFQNKYNIIRRKNFVSKLLISIGLLVFLGSISIFIFGKIEHSWSERHHRKEMIQYSKDLEHYNIYIKRAERYESENSWPEAIFELKHALLIFPDKQEANLKLADTYLKACTNANIYCNDGIKFVSSLINKYPNNNKLYELRAILYNSIGDTDNANKDYEMVN
jgi:tetratricopeptide (TPR) repeat protein